MAKCKYCDKAFNSDPKIHGTTSLKNHIAKCPKNPHNIETKQAKLIISANTASTESLTTLRSWRFDQDKIRKALATMIIMDELSFKFVQGVGFKKFIAECCPMFHIPSRWTIARDCYQFYIEEKKQLKQLFKNKCQRICLTADTWTSIQRFNYICITGHYIDENWNLHKRVLNFSTVFSHRGDLVGQQIENCLSDWGISDIFTITLDNASSNNGIVAHLQRKFSKRGGSILDAKFLHMRCIAHIINLIVQEGIKEVNSSISKIRAAVKFIRQSPARMQKFKKCAEFEKIESKCMLCLDVSTRWNSTYLMLSVATKYERAFERYDELEPYFRHDMEQYEDGLGFDGVPTENDWANARRLVIFLEKFYEMTRRISGSLYITSNTFFHEIAQFIIILGNLMADSDSELKSMAFKMKEKFDKYWGSIDKMNLNIYLAVIIDPRFKLKYVEFIVKRLYDDDSGPKLADLIRSTCVEMFNDYKKKSNSQISEKCSSDLSKCAEKNSVGATNVFDSLFQLFRHHESGIHIEANKSELEKYLDEALEPNSEAFDILNWWKVNSHRFPVLAQMARDLLAVPISTVASESTFSTGGRVLDQFRSSLTPKIVEALICTQDWMRDKNSSHSVNVEECIEEVDKLEEGENIFIFINNSILKYLTCKINNLLLLADLLTKGNGVSTNLSVFETI